METTKLSSKGQVIIPKSVRDAHDWAPGTEFEIDEAGDGILLRPARPFPVSTLDEVAGCLVYKGPAKTLQEMDDAVAREARKQRAS